MQTSFIKDILLIQDPSISKFYKEILVICGYFLAPFFTIALILEYFGGMNFGGVVKRLLIILIVMNSFFYLHTTASNSSLEFASYTLKKASPRNLFMKKWQDRKVRTKLPSGWDYVWIGNAKDTINDLFGTALFLLSKILFIVLKLIYSTVYHLNYAFSGYTALCYFFKWTEGALRGTFLSLVWCVLQPFVLVGVLCIVGNSFDESALRGEVVGSGVDHMAWLFGVSLLIVATPVITYGLISGAGVQGAGSKLSELVIGAGMKTISYGSLIPSTFKSMSGSIGKVGANSIFKPSSKRNIDKNSNGFKKQIQAEKNQLPGHNMTANSSNGFGARLNTPEGLKLFNTQSTNSKNPNSKQPSRESTKITNERSSRNNSDVSNKDQLSKGTFSSSTKNPERNVHRKSDYSNSPSISRSAHSSSQRRMQITKERNPVEANPSRQRGNYVSFSKSTTLKGPNGRLSRI